MPDARPGTHRIRMVPWRLFPGRAFLIPQQRRASFIYRAFVERPQFAAPASRAHGTASTARFGLTATRPDLCVREISSAETDRLGTDALQPHRRHGLFVCVLNQSPLRHRKRRALIIHMQGGSNSLQETGECKKGEVKKKRMKE